MSNIRLIALIIGGVLVYRGYAGLPASPKPSPDVPAVIQVDTAPDSLPQAPTGSVASSSAPIVEILKGDKGDAIKLARAYKGWSELMGRSSKIKNTDDFYKVYVEANKTLFEKHAMVGKYQGRLDAAMNNVIIMSFQDAGFVEGGAIKSEPWSPSASAAAQRALDAISYQCYQAFLSK